MLTFLSRIYGALTSLRNFLYDKGICEAHDLGARTISVGNLTTGGTGKTPLVAYLALALAERGDKVCVLTRGYGRDAPRRRVLVSDGKRVLVNALTGGDEPVELATKLLGRAMVIADVDRIGAAEWARRRFGVTAFVLDDAFQHRKVKRDVDICCIDATRPFREDRILPSGSLREATAALARAHIVVITRAEQSRDLTDLRSQITAIAPTAAVFEASTVLDQVVSEGGRLLEPNIPVLAFCGLGNPENFYTLLRANGYTVTGSRSFRDHHSYTAGDLPQLEAEADRLGARALVTTAKDAVKLDAGKTLPLYVAQIKIVIDRENEFLAAL